MMVVVGGGGVAANVRGRIEARIYSFWDPYVPVRNIPIR